MGFDNNQFSQIMHMLQKMKAGQEAIAAEQKKLAATAKKEGSPNKNDVEAPEAPTGSQVERMSVPWCTKSQETIATERSLVIGKQTRNLQKENWVNNNKRITRHYIYKAKSLASYRVHRDQHKRTKIKFASVHHISAAKFWFLTVIELEGKLILEEWSNVMELYIIREEERKVLCTASLDKRR